MAQKQDVLFKEEQRFSQWLVWIIVILCLSIPTYGIIQQIILKKPFGDNPMPDYALIILFAGMLLLCLLLGLMKLRTFITKEHIHIKFVPLANKKIFWEEIEEVKIVKYSPMIGYGLRIWTPYGTVYNVKGTKGLALKLKNGKKLMIGTQRFREIEEVAQRMIKKV